MSAGFIGVLYCLIFIVLEATQSVYFGGVFQQTDSFLIGALIFSATTVVFLTLVAWRTPTQFARARALWRPIVMVNVLTTVGWFAYFLAVQMLEPAVVYTIFSGMLPISVVVGAWFAVPEADRPQSLVESFGHAVVAAAIVFLCAVTLAGLSGFTRGSFDETLLGLLLCVLSGSSITWAVFYCRRMDGQGLKPEIQFGVRFPLYVVAASICAGLGLDAKPETPDGLVAEAFLIGLLLIAVPIYAFQRAVALVSAMTIAIVSALGPFFVFGLQLLEQRVDYAPWTLAGIIIYCTGAMIAAWGATAQARARARVSVDTRL